MRTAVTTEREQRLLTFERVFDGPRELVFQAFTEPRRLAMRSEFGSVDESSTR
jgi:hypothetical protein